MILERHIQKLAQGVSGAQYIEWERKWDSIEKRCGVGPAKRHSMVLAGGEDTGTIIWEREWENLAVCELHYNKLQADPESKELVKEHSHIIGSERMELYSVVGRDVMFGESKA